MSSGDGISNTRFPGQIQAPVSSTPKEGTGVSAESASGAAGQVASPASVPPPTPPSPETQDNFTAKGTKNSWVQMPASQNWLDAEATELHERVFVQNGLPLHPGRINSLDAQGLRKSAPFVDAVNTWTQSSAAMNPQDLDSFAQGLQGLNHSDQEGLRNLVNAYPGVARQLADFQKKLQGILAAYPDGDPLEALYLVFRESIRETNEDKKYFLKKLSDFNKIGEALSKYLSDLTQKSRNIENKKNPGMSAGEKQDVATNINVITFDLNNIDANGNPAKTSESGQSVNSASLANVLKDVEAQQESLRNNRQTAQTAFTNFDQKSNQLFNLMTNATKVMHDERMAPIRNML